MRLIAGVHPAEEIKYVFVDGVEYSRVYRLDTDEGWIDIFKDNWDIKRVHGKVTLEWRKEQ